MLALYYLYHFYSIKGNIVKWVIFAEQENSFVCLENLCPSKVWRSGPKNSRMMARSAGFGPRRTVRRTTIHGMGIPLSRCNAVTAVLPFSCSPTVINAVWPFQHFCFTTIHHHLSLSCFTHFHLIRFGRSVIKSEPPVSAFSDCWDQIAAC